MEESIGTYKKAYRKTLGLYMIAIVLLVWYVGYQIWQQKMISNATLFMTICIFTVCIAVIAYNLQMVLFSRVAYNVIRIPYEAGNILQAYEASKTILTIKAWYCEQFVLFNHMSILCAMGRYAELAQFYEEKRERLRKRVSNLLVERYLLIFASASQDEVLYEQIYHRFMRKNKKLFTRNRAGIQRIQFQIDHAIRAQHYEEAYHLSISYQAKTKLELLKQASYKSLCLWNLNRREEAQPFIDMVLCYCDEYECVRQIKGLKEGIMKKSFISSDFLQKVYGDFKKRKKKGRRRKCLSGAVFILLFIIAILLETVLPYRTYPYKTMVQAVNDTSDLVGEESYLQFDFDDIHVAVVRTAAKQEEYDKDDDDMEKLVTAFANAIPIYYVSMVKEENGKINNLVLDGGAYSFRETGLRYFPIKKSKDAVYVVFAGDYKSIAYDGELITNIKSTQMKETWKKDAVYTLHAFVLHDKNFDDEKLIVRR